MGESEGRSREDVAFEAEYWRAVLEDVAAASVALVAVAQEIAPVTVDLVELSTAGLFQGSTPADAVAKAVEAISGRTNAALERFAAVQEPLLRIVELADGRFKALTPRQEGDS